jgi:hypothetical protein
MSVSLCAGCVAGGFRKALDHALHLHEARALHEHGHVRRERVLELGEQLFDALEEHRAGPEHAHGLARELAERKQPVDAGLPRGSADLGVHRGRILAQLAHVA